MSSRATKKLHQRTQTLNSYKILDSHQIGFAAIKRINKTSSRRRHRPIGISPGWFFIYIRCRLQPSKFALRSLGFTLKIFIEINLSIQAGNGNDATNYCLSKSQTTKRSATKKKTDTHFRIYRILFTLVGPSKLHFHFCFVRCVLETIPDNTE